MERVVVLIYGEGELLLQVTIYFFNPIIRSVHNIRIERLWVDVTAQVGASWAEAFSNLELHDGLDINNTHHIWLLHHLFLQTLNQQLSFFSDSWNQHRMQIRGGLNRSPADMFGFDMIVHGLRGDYPDTVMTDEELEVYGVDWPALQNDQLLASARRSGQQETGSNSWISQAGPPDNLNEVPLFPPDAPYAVTYTDFDTRLMDWLAVEGQNGNISSVWNYGLALARVLFNHGDVVVF